MDSVLTLPGIGWNWSRWRKWGAYFVLWSIPALAAVSYYHLNRIVTAQPVEWIYGLVSTLPWWYLWAILTPLVLAVAKRFPIERASWAQRVGMVYVPLMLFLLAIHAAVSLMLFRWAGIHDTMNMALLEVHFTSRMHVNALAFWTMLGFYHAFDYARKYQVQQQEASTLELQLAQANLRALKMQLNPHFLFNTLHSVAALVRKNENKTAVNMLGRLGEFLRIALENQGIQQVPLKEELDFLGRYLEIEKIRFQDRLDVEIQVDLALLELYVPNLILQPIVENAIHHGVAPNSETGLITIKAYREGDRLIMQVRDNGPGLSSNSSKRKGVGLSNTEERLQRLYGQEQHIKFESFPGEGLLVEISIPAETTPSSRSSK